MPKPKPLIDTTGEVREVTADDLEKFHPAREALPASLQRKLGVREHRKCKRPLQADRPRGEPDSAA